MTLRIEWSIEHRMLYGWYRQRALPGLDLPRESYRSFDTMEEYRAWCERTYPEYCGYGRAKSLRPPAAPTTHGQPRTTAAANP